MRKEWMTSIRATLITLALLGFAYPLVTTAVAQALFPAEARGSLVIDGAGRPTGSRLIGQPFTTAAYLQPRPSAAGEKGYDASSSSGSNLGPTSRALRERVEKELARLTRDNPRSSGPVPVELVLASGSGLDPHLSPQAAYWQVPRIAAARHVAEARVRAVISSAILGRDLLVLGEERVNVLEVNLALDRHFGRPPMATR